MEKAKEVRIYRQKTLPELQIDIDKANQAIEKNPPPVEKTREIKTLSNGKDGIRSDIFSKSSFKKSF